MNMYYFIGIFFYYVEVFRILVHMIKINKYLEIASVNLMSVKCRVLDSIYNIYLAVSERLDSYCLRKFLRIIGKYISHLKKLFPRLFHWEALRNILCISRAENKHFYSEPVKSAECFFAVAPYGVKIDFIARESHLRNNKPVTAVT